MEEDNQPWQMDMSHLMIAYIKTSIEYHTPKILTEEQIKVYEYMSREIYQDDEENIQMNVEILRNMMKGGE